MDKINIWYIFRIDDVVPWMNRNNFEKIEKIFDKYWVKPIIWVVPNNQDFSIWNDKYTQDFWHKIKKLSDKWWIIAQHGYEHVYCNNNWWILKINKKSEFAWLPYEEQFEKLIKWKNILENNLNINIQWRMAPAHSFDKNTCKALKSLWFKYITDWLSLYPQKYLWLNWIPCQIRSPQKKYFGLRTICLHLNRYKQNFFDEIEIFCKKYNHLLAKNVSDIEYNDWKMLYFFNIIYKYKFYLEQYLYKKFITLKNKLC